MRTIEQNHKWSQNIFVQKYMRNDIPLDLLKNIWISTPPFLKNTLVCPKHGKEFLRGGHMWYSFLVPTLKSYQILVKNNLLLFVIDNIGIFSRLNICYLFRYFWAYAFLYYFIKFLKYKYVYLIINTKY